MLRTLIDRLTPEQRRALRDLGINHKHLYMWRHEQRLPTEVQIAMLAAVTGAEYGQLQREVTWQRAKPEERAKLAGVLGKSAAAVKAGLLGVAVMLGTFGANDRALAAASGPPDRDNV